ncbi:MAG: radical SAM family heme chaperone HemW [Nitrospirota bacterium]|nr:MAG: radical SAM family heme chaperone HemW [Nitrospirota bacterium]
MSHNQLFPYLRSRQEFTDLGLYIHVPFCRKRCHFCAFYLMVHREELVRAFLLALERELILWGKELGPVPVSTVYLGGGTPTSLNAKQLVRILEVVNRIFLLTSQVEISIEASPETVTLSALQELRKAGVNRLSLGAQSFDESVWEHLGRSGNIPDTRTALEQARQVGFQNISLDLMYGLPGQSLESWQQSLEEIIDLNPTHVSCYALTLEEGTRLYSAQHRGEVHVGDPELENRMCQIAASALTDAGYHQYEVSNYCQFGYECRHNLRYWTFQDYLGLGPSAQSCIGRVRFGNVDNLSEYCRRLDDQEIPLASVEVMSKHQADRERVVFGLRLVNGLDIQGLKQLAGDDQWRGVVYQLIEEGLLCHDERTLRLTPYGRRFADSVAVQLL